METLKLIPRGVWIGLSVFLLLIIITSYSQGKLAGLSECK